MHDIFVTHDWRVTDEQQAATLLLDQAYGMGWRNFGTAWYDPSISLNSPDGNALVRGFLREQVLPARVVLLVGGLHAGSHRGALWCSLAVEQARAQGTPVIGLPPRGQDAPQPAQVALADVWVPWDAAKLAEAVEAAERSGPAPHGG